MGDKNDGIREASTLSLLLYFVFSPSGLWRYAVLTINNHVKGISRLGRKVGN